jgi:hypothetical protein
MNEQAAPEESQRGRSPWLVRFGGTVGTATLAALFASMPAAFRMQAGGLDVVRSWIAPAGLAIAPMLLLVPLARLARDGLRGFASTDGSRALERVAAAMVFAGTWLWFLSALGAQLRDKTHQRALGAVTFALVALVSLVVLALVARRLAAIIAAIRAKHRALGTAAAGIAIALSALVLALRLARGAPYLAPDARALLVDGLAFALALAFAARKTFQERPLLARVGPPVAVCVLVLAMHTLATSQTALLTLEHDCPLHFALLKAFARLAF